MDFVLVSHKRISSMGSFCIFKFILSISIYLKILNEQYGGIIINNMNRGNMGITKLYDKNEKAAFNVGYERGQLHLVVELIARKIITYDEAVELVKKLDLPNCPIENRINAISYGTTAFDEYDMNNEMDLDKYVDQSIELSKHMSRSITIFKTREDGFYLGVVFDAAHRASVNKDKFKFKDLRNALTDRGIDNWVYDTDYYDKE